MPGAASSTQLRTAIQIINGCQTILLNNYKNITPFEIALSDSKGTQKLKKGEKKRLSLTSLSEDDSSTVETVEVRVRTLDSLLEEIDWSRTVDVVKIDVGAEMKVMKEAAIRLHRTRI